MSIINYITLIFILVIDVLNHILFYSFINGMWIVDQIFLY